MRYYEHSQGSASATWTVSHNLNSECVASDVFIDPTHEKILPLSVVHQDNNTLVITFSTAQSGVARIFGV